MPLVTLEQREPDEATIAMVCSSCQVLSRTDARLPRGWKRSGKDIFCKKCWRGGNVLRAVSVPIAQPLDCSWEDLRKVLREMWIQTTQASNWIVTELYARDVRRGNQVLHARGIPRAGSDGCEFLPEGCGYSQRVVASLTDVRNRFARPLGMHR